MERKRKEVDRGKSKSQLASSSRSIHSQAPKAPVKMEQDGSPASNARAALYYNNVDEIVKKARFGEATRASMKMEKDRSSRSKARASSHSLDIMEKATKASVKMEKNQLSTNKAKASSHSLMEIKERARLGEATRELVKMEKDQSSRSKARASSHSLDIMEKATKASVKMEKDQSSTNKARASSHSLMEIKEKARLGEATRALVKTEKDQSSRSKARASSHSLDIMEEVKLGEATKESVKMEKDRSSTSKARASSHSLMEIKEKARLGEATRALVKMEKEGSSASKAIAGSQFSFGTMGKSKPEYPRHSHPECKDQLRGLGESGKQVGEPSQRRFRLYEICEICCERKDRTEMFRNEGCRHRVCTDCIRKYIEVKIESNSGMIVCPGLDCRGVLAPERCKEFLPKRVVERWEKTIIETMILDSEKFYCPFKDCSSMLLNDNAEGMMMMRESECPHCRRLFCVQCRVPWHSEMECREFQQLNADERGREDILLKKLAKEKKWKRCPICKFYVEKTEGCVHMTCRCGFEFCYRCGGKWSMEHGTCQM